MYILTHLIEAKTEAEVKKIKDHFMAILSDNQKPLLEMLAKNRIKYLNQSK
jgi:hypothetical protein